MKRILLFFLISGFASRNIADLAAQNVILNNAEYNLATYPGYNPDGSVQGIFTINISKDFYSFQNGQFGLKIVLPASTVYAGGGTLPSEFQVTQGVDGSTQVTISIVSQWAGTGPTARRSFQLPVKIIAPGEDLVATVDLDWRDNAVVENPAGNSVNTTVTVDNFLPVKLNSFQARAEERVVRLLWETAAEENSDYFEIQHSTDSKSWIPLGKLASNQNSTGIKRYSFQHYDVSAGSNYYRLKMVDLGGSFEMSPIERVNIGATGLISANAYPNPVTNSLRLESKDWAKVSNVKLYDAQGQKAYDSGDKPTTLIDVHHLSAGMYILRVTSAGDLVESLKIMIVR